jgi:hypothetical protein
MYAPIFSLIYIYSSIFIYIPIYACTFLQTIPRISKVLSCPFAGLGDVGSEVETLHDDKQSWFSSWIASYCAVRRHVGEKKHDPNRIVGRFQSLPMLEKSTNSVLKNSYEFI